MGRVLSGRGARLGGILLGALLSACPGALGVERTEDALGIQPPREGLALALWQLIQRNPAVQGKREEVMAQSFQVRSAQARWLPRLGVSAASVDNGGLDGQASLRLEQPVWSFGKLSGGVSVAKAQLSAEERDLLRVQRELMGEVIDAYLKIRGLLAEEEVVMVNIREHERLLGHMRRREAGQLAADADVQLGQSRLIQAQSQRLRLENDLRGARAALDALTVLPLPSTPPVPASLLDLPSMEALKATALAEDAEVLYRAALADSAHASARLAKAELRPDILLRAETNFIEDPLRAGAGPRVGLVVQSSLEGLGLVNYRRGQGAEARAAAAAQDVKFTRAQVDRDLATLIQRLELIEALVAAQQEAVASVQTTAESYLRLYDAGRKSWLDLLNIQRELTEQRRGLVQVQAERKQVTLQLALRAGRLDELAKLSVASPSRP